MTEKLYYLDSHMFEFEAEVLECRELERGWGIILDRTAFFPEGGGLHIIPASADLDRALQLPGMKVLMKSGSAIHETVQALERAGLLDRAALVADCGLPTEQVYRDLRKLPESLSYFATIIVQGA